MEKKKVVAKVIFKYAEAYLSEHHLFIKSLSYIYMFSREKGRRAQNVFFTPFVLLSGGGCFTFNLYAYNRICFYMVENSLFRSIQKAQS